jgi:hypothetical protein
MIKAEAEQQELRKKHKAAKKALLDFEDKHGIKFALEQAGALHRDMWALWKEAPCFIQVFSYRRNKTMLASKKPMTRQQIATWKKLDAAVLELE